MYDYSDIRYTHREIWIANKNFYYLSAAVEHTFMYIMFKNHTIYHIIHNYALLAAGVIAISFRDLQEEITTYLIVSICIYFIVLAVFQYYVR